jgi:hypothetical protein
LEKLQVQNLNSIDIEIQPVNDQLDTDFKPGLFQMVEAFLSNDKNQHLPSIWRHQKNTKSIYSVMLPEKIEHCNTARVMGSEKARANS